MTGGTKLEMKLLKNSPSKFSVLTTAVLGKKRTSKKLPNKDIHFTLQSDNTKHKPFKFILRPNFIAGYQNLSPGV